MFQEFVKAIVFSQLDLLDNAMTGNILSLAKQSQEPIPIRNGYQTE
jgi:hypothetical protein